MNTLLTNGYWVIDDRKSETRPNEIGYVLAMSYDQYATWEYRIDEYQNTYWGHYFQNFESAVEDFIRRVKGE